MDVLTVGIGAAAILYALYTLYLRTQQSAKFGKLKAMKERFGDTAGGIIHFVAYSLVPLVFGVVTLLAGLRGQSFF